MSRATPQRRRCWYNAAALPDGVDPHQERSVDLERVEAARANGQETRLLVPLTRVSGDAALQVELTVPTLDALDAFREAGVGGETETVGTRAERVSA